MTRSDFLTKLMPLIIVTIILAAALWIVFGAQWFSFYGVASSAVFALPILCALLIRRANAQSHRRWPIVLVTVLAILLAAVQLGYWWAFFNMGVDGIPLGIARQMLPGLVKQILAWSPVVLALPILWFVLRALRT